MVTRNDLIIDSSVALDRYEEMSEDDYRFTEAELDEFDALIEFIDYMGEDEAENGIDCIRDTHFTEYVRDESEYYQDYDTEAWPFRHIDWDAAAEELKTDYFHVDFDGVDYWYKS